MAHTLQRPEFWPAQQLYPKINYESFFLSIKKCHEERNIVWFPMLTLFPSIHAFMHMVFLILSCWTFKNIQKELNIATKRDFTKNLIFELYLTKARWNTRHSLEPNLIGSLSKWNLGKAMWDFAFNIYTWFPICLRPLVFPCLFGHHDWCGPYWQAIKSKSEISPSWLNTMLLDARWKTRQN